jgi:Fe/S biogenesis protein NfuA
MAVTERQIIDITPEAVEAILGIRAQEPDADELALAVSIAGVSNFQFRYELTFIPLEDAADDDIVHTFGDLPVVVPEGSADRLQGAVILMRDGGLSMDNPNSPSPTITTGNGELEGSLPEKVRTILDEHINPAIAAHGGAAQLVAVEGDTVYLRLGGGCQGCGMATVTLRQGIEAAIKQALPEVKHIVDVTDHDAGTNPYYEPAGHSHHGHSH